MAGEKKKRDGLEKAALLIMSLDEELASEILKNLSPTEVHKISSKIASMREVSKDMLEEVAKEFEERASSTLSLGGDEYVKKVLTKALGPDRANAILERILEGEEGGGLEQLKWMEPRIVADIVKNEHPQTIAVVVAHLEPEQASEILSHLPERTRGEVLLRLATMEAIPSDAMKELEQAIMEQLKGTVASRNRLIGGIKAAAEILNYMDSTSEKAIMETIEKVDSDLATKIQEQMFTFADLVKIDDMGIQTLLKEVSSEQLVLALKTAEEELKEKIFRNMSERAREMLKEEMETKGPVKLSEVEKAQQEIVRIARRLEQEGKIIIGGKGGEEVLV